MHSPSVLRMVLILALAGAAPATAQDSPSFDAYFLDRTLRIDFFHTGDGEEEVIALDRIHELDLWAGRHDRLIEPFGVGRYRATLIDVATNRTLFTRGFDSYFGEYKTTAPAKAGKVRTYHETVLAPRPKKPFLLVITVADTYHVHHPLFREVIDPNGIDILREGPASTDRVIPVLRNGAPRDKVDLVFVAEGYAADEEAAFVEDLKKYADALFAIEPYHSRKSRFNISGVFRPSPESGVDEPRKGIFRNTAVGASFNALGLERYLLTEDNRTFRDLAGRVPYDAAVILVNSDRYGGGGIYRYYAIFTADSGAWEKEVFYHEFGHAFAGLADEYYGASVAYSDFFPEGVEPREPNITALLDPERLKWRHLVDGDAKIPTEWDKAAFDGLCLDYEKIRREQSERLFQLRREGAAEEVIARVSADYGKRTAELNAKIHEFMHASPLRDTVGVFEGAGYQARGLYRPQLNCIMHKFTPQACRFCKVCEDAIARRIDFLSVGP